MKNIIQEKTFFKRLPEKINKIFYRCINGPVVIPMSYDKKRNEILKYAKAFETKIFIETGTYYGETAETLQKEFKKLFTVELDRKLYEESSAKLKKYSNVTTLHGDSGTVLREIMKQINEPTIFWLDAHYSGGPTAKGKTETPIIEELRIISEHSTKKHVVLIDDARCFNGEHDYPTLTELATKVKSFMGNIFFDVQDDIIRITPSETQNIRSKKIIHYNEPLRLRFGRIYKKWILFIKKIISGSG